MIGGGLVAGLVGAVLTSRVGAGAAAATGTPAAADENTLILQKIYDELLLHRSTCGAVSCASLDNIRRQQSTFVWAHGRYPEFIDVGLGAGRTVRQPCSIDSEMSDERRPNDSSNG
jgi:hypothetical protein